jgi:hypothetical protein
MTTNDGVHESEEPREIGKLMTAIAQFDCEPGVFTVAVQAHDHMIGFDAYIQFRSTVPGALASISSRGNSPFEALLILYRQLKEKYGPCPTCGQQRHEVYK